MKRWLWVIAVLLGLAVAAYVGFYTPAEAEQYRFVEIEKGDIEFVVTSTGALKAVTTVQVGTQVSGIVEKIFVDFNDHVKAGQVIAQIDTTLLVIAVREAEANLERAEAQLIYAQRNFERIQALHAQKVVTESQFIEAEYNFATAKAGQKSALASLERARRNLSYATIYAPISGTVVERNVNVGQTVAASFSAPQLFLIANDLTRMQIEVSVDESDIGLIINGQEAHFTVQAFPEKVFAGKVRQVRLQSKAEESVVSYTVVVDVDNQARLLLPGMTANVDFVVNRETGIYKVSNAALRFRPVDVLIEDERGRAVIHSGLRQGADVPENARLHAGRKMHTAKLWFLDQRNRLFAVDVSTGISDGQMTKIYSTAMPAEIVQGRKVIAGYAKSPAAAASSPFQAGRSQERGPRF